MQDQISESIETLLLSLQETFGTQDQISNDQRNEREPDLQRTLSLYNNCQAK